MRVYYSALIFLLMQYAITGNVINSNPKDTHPYEIENKADYNFNNGLATRILVSGDVDDDFWLKYLGEEFRHAIQVDLTDPTSLPTTHHITESVKDIQHDHIAESVKDIQHDHKEIKDSTSDVSKSNPSTIIQDYDRINAESGSELIDNAKIKKSVETESEVKNVNLHNFSNSLTQQSQPIASPPNDSKIKNGADDRMQKDFQMTSNKSVHKHCCRRHQRPCRYYEQKIRHNNIDHANDKQNSEEHRSITANNEKRKELTHSDISITEVFTKGDLSQKNTTSHQSNQEEQENRPNKRTPASNVHPQLKYKHSLSSLGDLLMPKLPTTSLVFGKTPFGQTSF